MKRWPLSIGSLTCERTREGAWRVAARVGDAEVSFTSRTPLAPAREAFLQAFQFPAMRRGRDLLTDGPVCPRWAENAERAQAIARRWWGLGGGRVHAQGTEALEPATGRLLFFGGGVDSTYALLRERSRLTHLVYVEGYDVPREDAERLARVDALNRAVAAACGLELVVVRTDLREHPDFRVLPWTNAFGGALAAVGHLLRGVCADAWVANDGHVVEIAPAALGMHPALTPCWSSAAVRFAHHGEGTLRCEKVQAIATWPLALRHLRVCWQNRGDGLDCGTCEKCVRTQVELLAAGRRDGLASMPAGDLAARIAALPPVPPNLLLYYQDALAAIRDPSVRRALLALEARSRERAPRAWWRRLAGGIRREREGGGGRPPGDPGARQAGQSARSQR